MNNIYYIKAGDTFNQCFFFTNYEYAHQWIKNRTGWSDDEIHMRIITLSPDWEGKIVITPNRL